MEVWWLCHAPVAHHVQRAEERLPIIRLVVNVLVARATRRNRERREPGARDTRDQRVAQRDDLLVVDVFLAARPILLRVIAGDDAVCHNQARHIFAQVVRLIAAQKGHTQVI